VFLFDFNIDALPIFIFHRTQLQPLIPQRHNKYDALFYSNLMVFKPTKVLALAGEISFLKIHFKTT